MLEDNEHSYKGENSKNRGRQGRSEEGRREHFLICHWIDDQKHTVVAPTAIMAAATIWCRATDKGTSRAGRALLQPHATS